MSIDEIYPFFKKVQSSLSSLLDGHPLDLLSTPLGPMNQSVIYYTKELENFYDTWFFKPFKLDLDSINASFRSDCDVNLATLFEHFNNSFSDLHPEDFERIYTVTYIRGSVEVEGKFTGRYLIWSLVEYTIHTRAIIYNLLLNMDIATPTWPIC